MIAGEAGVDIYNLIQIIIRSNQNTYQPKKVIVNLGDKVARGGDVLADGPSTDG